MPKEFSRTRRVGAQIQRDLASYMQQELRDPRLGLITLTAVEVSHDLTHAKVYVSLIGNQWLVPEVIRRLQDHAGAMRHWLAQRLTTRICPMLRFVYDESVERGARVDALLASTKSPDASDES